MLLFQLFGKIREAVLPGENGEKVAAYAAERKMLVRGDFLIPFEHPIDLAPGEIPQKVMCRMRSLGCTYCTGAIRSEASTIGEIIDELKGFRRSERENRVIDHDQEGSMELKKLEGYF